MAHLLPYYKAGVIEAGCDEAGRGCLAGPVFAASVILPPDFFHPLLNDSKQLSEKQRNLLRIEIERDSIAYAVASIDNKEIDEINILNASIKAMHLSLDKLKALPAHIIIDGNRFKPYKNIPFQCVVKGDGKYYSIAAASVLAKTYRDEFMLTLAKEFPEYCWEKNKGYPTLEHRKAVQKYGPCKWHRKTFLNKILDPQLNLF